MSAVTFTLSRVPPSWSNRRGHWRSEYKAKKDWKDLTWFAAAAARVLAPEPSMRLIPDARSAPDKRTVVITVHRCQLLDPDNLLASVKPVVDGLKKQLIVDDAPRWLELEVHQVKVTSRKAERVEIYVARSSDAQVDSRATRQSVAQGGSG